jgi:hypothetical protein
MLQSPHSPRWLDMLFRYVNGRFYYDGRMVCNLICLPTVLLGEMGNASHFISSIARKNGVLIVQSSISVI